MNQRNLLLMLLGCMALLGGCGSDKGSVAEAKPDQGRPATPVTTFAAEQSPVEVLESSVGRLEAVAAPAINAEVAGRVAAVRADEGDWVAQGTALAELDTTDFDLNLAASKTEVKRLQALLANQQSTVERYRKLRREGTISVDALDSAESQLKALREQLAAARTQQKLAEHNLTKTRIVAHVSGRVEERAISAGDFVGVGTPMFRIADPAKLRVVLPFPESAVGRVRPGLELRLQAAHSNHTVVAEIDAVRPLVQSASNALHAIAYIDNPGDWKPGASVSGTVVLARRGQAVVVPSISVVRRPAGTVVYVVEDGKARQRVVVTGVRIGDRMEIREGIGAGEPVIVDGAGFLTDGTAVRAKDQSS